MEDCIFFSELPEINDFDIVLPVISVIDNVDDNVVVMEAVDTTTFIPELPVN